MRINGVAGGLKQKKSLSEYVKSSISYFMSQVTRKKAKKSILSDRYRSIDIDFWKTKPMRIDGVAGGVKQKKSL